MVDRITELSKYKKQVDESKNILIVGGGIVGVELAGELAFHEKAAEKKITLAARGDRLL